MCDDNAFLELFSAPINVIRKCLETEGFYEWDNERRNEFLNPVFLRLIGINENEDELIFPIKNPHNKNKIIENLMLIFEIYENGVDIAIDNNLVPIVIYNSTISASILNALNEPQHELPVLIYTHRPQWVQDLATYQVTIFRM